MQDSMRCSGMRDMLPEEMARFRRVERAFREVALGWGYEEVRTPTIEHLHLFTSAGTLTPQMLGRVYSFLDWDGWRGERVVLRPDSTIPLARLYSERSEPGGRYFYVQNVFRFAQGDDSREDWQCGIELIGDTQPLGDVELMLVAGEICSRLGLEVQVILSDPAILRIILAKAGYDSAEQLALYDRILDGELSVLDEVAERIPGAGPVRSLLSLRGEGLPYLENLRAALLPAVPDLERPLGEIAAVSDILTRTGAKHAIAPLLVRDFEYYTGPVFHFEAGGSKLGGGGRYDALISLVGGADVPASGFALEMQLIAGRLSEAEESEEGLLLIQPRGRDNGDLAAALKAARALREGGRRVRVVATGFTATGPYIVAASDGFEFRANGAAPRRFNRPDELVTALAGTGP